MQRFLKTFGPTATLLVLVGCVPRPTQEDVESEAAASVFLHVNRYTAFHTNTSVTNIAQVYAGLNLTNDHRSHPARFQKKFRQFGKYAGFTNSFYEKYVFLPQGMTSSIVRGEVLFLNAQPFPGHNGELGRIIFYYFGGDRSQRDFRWFSEQEVQQIFGELGIPIPAAPSLPLPPVREVSYEEPLKSRVQRHFDALAHHWNLPRSMGKYLMWGAFLLVVIPIAILCWYGLRRVQK